MKRKAYTGKELTEILKAEILSSDPESIRVEDILIDSRKFIRAPKTLFFALRGKPNDGHKYIPNLYKKGIRYFVVSDKNFTRNIPQDASFFVVENTLKALQQLAAFHRSQFHIPVIGITGSNGKTIVKEWLFQLMGDDKKIVRSPKSYNSQVGVPLSVWQMNAEHELAIFEAGISRPDEMEHLQTIIRPTIGIFTNIGEAHNEGFISKAQKIGEKLKLFTRVNTLIYNSDQKELLEVMIRSGILENIHTFTWGSGPDNDLQITEKITGNEVTVIKGIYKENEISVEIPFTDKASIENATHCWTTLLVSGYTQETIRQRMQALTPIAMRLEQRAGINNCTIINDAYNSDLNSLTIALDFMDQQNQHRDKVVILSDILQSGRSETELYGNVADLLKQKGISRIIGIGEAISRNAALFEMEKDFFPDTRSFISGFPTASFHNQTILLKGARIFEFERINRLLQQKVHETVFEINLTALTDNLNFFRSKLKPGTKVMAMVKAFSYGSGSFEIANILQFHQADYLAVAYADEGVELRNAGIQLPIMVMTPEEYAFDLMIKHQLEPEIFSFRALRLLNKAIRRNQLPQNKPVKIHLKLETGMHRLGFREEDLDELMNRINKNPLIDVQSVFSHLAAADQPAMDDFTRKQIERFRKMAEKLKTGLTRPFFMHLLNSAGTVRFPEAQFDMVRLGIGLFGTSSVPEINNKLRNVTSLRSEIAQIKEVKAYESVGYNRRYLAKETRRIATVSIGYADGLFRSLGNGNFSFWINGRPAPLTGDICMDMCMVDVTDIEAKEGDPVIIFNDEHPVTEPAAAAGTIPYEILGRISRRVKRVYFHD
jgi:alanine racemase